MTTIIHSSKNFRAVRATFPSSAGEEKVIEYIEQPNLVIAVPVTLSGTVILVEHQRPILNRNLLECPGGKVDENETLETAIVRELKEEIGYIPRKLDYCSSFYSSVGTSTEKVHFFVAQDLQAHARKEEDILRMKVKEFSTAALLAMIENDVLLDGKTIVALLRYLMRGGYLEGHK